MKMKKHLIQVIGVQIVVVLLVVVALLVTIRIRSTINNPSIAHASSKKSSRADRILSPPTLVDDHKTSNGKCIADYTNATEANPDDPNTYRSLVDAHFRRALVYERKGDYDKAFAEYTKAIEIMPKDVRLAGYLIRGWAYAKYAAKHGDKSDYDNAVADYTKAIELCPDCASVYRYRGGTYLVRAFEFSARDDFDKGIADFTKAIELDPEEDEAYYGRGIAYHLVGNLKKAWEDVQKAEALGKQVDPQVLKAISYFTLGSHKDEVVKAQGTPDSIKRLEILDCEVWMYGPSTVEFSMQDGRVTEWDNCGNLKVWLGPGHQFTPTKPWAMKQMQILQALGRGQQFTRTNPPEHGRISSIARSEDKHTAMIGTEVVGEGDIIDGVTVVKIYDDRVVFEKGGKRWTQELGDAPDPAWR